MPRLHHWEYDEQVEATLTKEPVRLRSSSNVDIMPLCFGTIHHNVTLQTDGGVVMLCADQDVFMSRCLVVNHGPRETGEVRTEVFNLSKSTVRIQKGESISYLVAL